MSEAILPAPVHKWLAGPLPAGVEDSLERLRRAEDVAYVAVLPDVHLADDVCVGVALATNRLIYPAAVGSDIGCGMAAIRFDADADLLAIEEAAGAVLGGLTRCVPALKHPSATAPSELPSTLGDAPLSHPRLEKLKSRDGRLQLGTLGRGNHFLEFQADEQEQLWLMVHSGSRSMGQAISAHHSTAGKADKRRLIAIDSESSEGQAYLSDVAWAIAYAQANRLAIIAAVSRLMQSLFGVVSTADSLIQCHHNHVRQEIHFGRRYWVHRKGALSAGTDVPGLIPGSMGTVSFHVSGRGHPPALASSSHGAGRCMSRRDAMQKITRRELERELSGVWFDHRRIDALRDEAPSAYKDIGAVMRAQRDLTRIERRLRPLLSYKGM
ncbi:MAG TPA: RtcB family protein [Planctomycetaceae bacterium]|jgi:tRNA-splicing ligase RtcB|nr:RtcB family protein [Planctomycetaceae bacterium]